MCVCMFVYLSLITKYYLGDFNTICQYDIHDYDNIDFFAFADGLLASVH